MPAGGRAPRPAPLDIFEESFDVRRLLNRGRLLRAAADWKGEPLLALAVTRNRLEIHYRIGAEWVRTDVEAPRGRPLVQLLGSELLLVAGPESRRSPGGDAEPNGSVFGLDGELLDRILLGDGVADVHGTASGRLWVAYGLLGTTGDYGVHGWGRLSPEEWVDPVGYTGLVLLDREGHVRSEFTPPEGGAIMNDCFALNAWGEGAWACYHPGFALARVGTDGRATVWPLEAGPVESIAADDHRLLMARGSLAEGAWAGEAGEDGRLELRPLDLRDPGRGGPLLGRGRWLHRLAGGRWFRAEVSRAWELGA